MWPLISPASGAPVSASFALISECPVGSHHRLAAGARDLVEQHLARLDVGEDRRARMALQHVARQHDHQLVAPQDAALRVDDADAVAVAVEGDAEIAALRRATASCSCTRFSGDGRVGVMRRKGAVDRLVDQDVRARAAARSARLTTSPVAPLPRVPGDLQRARRRRNRAPGARRNRRRRCAPRPGRARSPAGRAPAPSAPSSWIASP